MIPIYSSTLVAQIAGAIFSCDAESIEASLPMFAPIPTSFKELRHRQAVNQVLRECWRDDNDGYAISLGEEMIVNARSNPQAKNDAIQRLATIIADTTPPLMAAQLPNLAMPQSHDTDDDQETGMPYEPSTYGEVTPVGARQLFGEMGLMKSPSRPRDSSSFMDLGSGVGKLVCQAYLELKPPFHNLERAIGIELAQSRHQSALLAKSRMIENFPNLVNPLDSFGDFPTFSTPEIELLEGDLLQVDLSRVTHIYVASLCFPEELMRQLEDKLSRNIRRRASSPSKRSAAQSLQCVATLQPFPGDQLGTPRVRYIEMSWTKPRGSPVYFYSYPFL